MKSFKLVKRTKAGECDAMRCSEPSAVVYADGMKLCLRHAGMINEDEAFGVGLDAAHDTPAESDTVLNESAIAEELAPLVDEAIVTIEQLVDFEITSPEEAEIVDALLIDAHSRLKEIEAKRTKATTPLLAAKREIDSWFAPAKTAFEGMKNVLKEKLQNWHDSQRVARQEALNSGDIKTALAAPEAETTTSTTVRKEWIFEIENIDLVPRSFLTVDSAAISAEMKRVGPENTKIPGVKIYQKEKIVMGRG